MECPTKVTNYYSTVNFASSNLSNSISGRKNGANFAQIGQFLFKISRISNFKIKISAKKFASSNGRQEFLNASRQI
jgi:hypothetical protein